MLLLRCNDEAKFRVLARLPEGPEAAGLSPEVWVSSVGMHEFKGKQKKLVSDLKKVFRAQG